MPPTPQPVLPILSKLQIKPILLKCWRIVTTVAKGVIRFGWKPVPLFRIARVPVQLHLTWLFYPTGTWLYAAHQSIYPNATAWTALFLLVLVFSLLLHELGHVIAARKYRIHTRRIIIIPFGMVALLRRLPRPPHEFWVALAGPATSFALSGLFWLAAVGAEKLGISWRYHRLDLLELASFLNLILAVGNLLPCYPMDGGRMLRSAMASLIHKAFHRNRDHALLIATRIVVRWVAWPIFCGIVVLAIHRPAFWFEVGLLLFILTLAELEYSVLRDETNPKQTASTR